MTVLCCTAQGCARSVCCALALLSLGCGTVRCCHPAAHEPKNPHSGEASVSLLFCPSPSVFTAKREHGWHTRFQLLTRAVCQLCSLLVLLGSSCCSWCWRLPLPAASGVPAVSQRLRRCQALTAPSARTKSAPPARQVAWHGLVRRVSKLRNTMTYTALLQSLVVKTAK